jgi:hypothetical protein
MAQVVECLPSKHKTRSSNPSNIKKKKKKTEEIWMIISKIVTLKILTIAIKEHAYFPPF